VLLKDLINLGDLLIGHNLSNRSSELKFVLLKGRQFWVLCSFYKYLHFSVGIGFEPNKNFLSKGAFHEQKYNKGPVKPLKGTGSNIFV